MPGEHLNPSAAASSLFGNIVNRENLIPLHSSRALDEGQMLQSRFIIRPQPSLLAVSLVSYTLFYIGIVSQGEYSVLRREVARLAPLP